MTRTSRSLLLAGALVVAAGLAGLGAGWLSRSGERPTAVPGPRERLDPTAARAGSETPVAPERRQTAEVRLADLEVRAIDARGGPLPDTALRATGPGGGVREGKGSARWTGLEPGEWTIEARHPDHPLHTTRVRLEPGVASRSILRIDDAIRVEGRLTDPFGSPRPGERLWFLRPGEVHPAEGESARAALVAVTQRDGRFRIDLPEADLWRVSLGTVGDQVALSPPHRLEHGGPHVLEVVLGGATRLEVALAEPLPEDARRRLVQVLARAPEIDEEALPLALLPGTPGGSRVDDSPDYLDGEIDVLRRERARRLDAQQQREESGAPPPVPEPIRVPRAPAELPEWIVRAGAQLGPGGTAVLEGLPAGEELRIALVVDEARSESATAFVLRPDEIGSVEITAPPGLASAADTTGTLAIRFRTQPPPADARPPGFYWR